MWRGVVVVVAIVVVTVGCEQVVPARLNRMAALQPVSTATASPSPIAVRIPSPSPTPPPVATPKTGGGAARPLADCTRVVVHSFTAQPQGGSQVLLAWSTSNACTPVSGWIGGSYGAAGALHHWTDYIHAASGSFVDNVPLLPLGTDRIYCVTSITYMLSIGGSSQLTTATASNVWVC